jgi:hypothetical protein
MSVLAAETDLLQSARDYLRLKLSLTEAQCNCEPSEQAPATTGDIYYAVIPGGMSTGEVHNPSGGVFDFEYGVDVLVAMRIGNVPRDRQRNTFLDNLSGLAVKCDGVIGWLDFRYAVTTGANQLLAVHAPGTEPFMHPLVFSGGDGMPRWTPPGFWGETQAQLDAGNVKVGMMRKLSFRKARRITYRTGVA